MFTSITALVTDYYPTFQQITSSYSQPVRETFVKISHRRNPMLTVIKIALLQFKDRGTKLSFVVNGLKFDEPTWAGRLGRTISCYTNPDGNASAKHYHNLLVDILQAYDWYGTIEGTSALFEEMKKGLKALKATYPHREVDNFVDDAYSIVDEGRMPTEEEQKTQEEETAETADEEVAEPLERKEQIRQALRKEIDEVICNLIDEHFIYVVARQFQTIHAFESERDKKQVAGAINETIRGKTTELNQTLLRTIRSTIDA
jgi:hypothetical protein